MSTQPSAVTPTAVGVVEVGLGNTASVHNMFRRLGLLTRGVSAPADLDGLAGLVLPGVGAFDTGMRQLHGNDLVGPIKDLAAAGTPLLGICLGMQLLCAGSEEGDQPGLGIFDLPVTSLRTDRPNAPVPHVGWEYVTVIADNLLLPRDELNRFYFTHSYAVAASTSATIATAECEGAPVTAAIACGMTFGVQFHPEKSHDFGQRLLLRFWEHACCAAA